MKKSCASGLPRMSLMKRCCCQSRAATSRCLCRYMNVPYERGRYDIESFTERRNDAFIKFHPQASPPSPYTPLAPLRDDVPLTEPCSGRLSAAARADLRLTDSDTFTRTVSPSLGPPAGTWGTSANERWNSTVNLTVPAKLQNFSRNERPDPGSTSSLGHGTAVMQTHDRPVTSYEGHIGYLAKDVFSSVCPKSMDKALRYIYTLETQRGYEDLDWDSKLSPCLKPPLSTLEKMADPVSQHFTLKRYHSRPELWQTIGPHWNRHQIRATYNVKKPFSFTSPCPKSGQIPLYSGVIGSENMDNIDIPEKEFTPLTLLRTVLPPDTPTAHRPTIPGYTGKAVYDKPHTLATNQPSSMLTHQTKGSSSTPSSFGRQAPLSRIVTRVPPSNPFLQPKAPPPPLIVSMHKNLKNVVFQES